MNRMAGKVFLDLDATFREGLKAPQAGLLWPTTVHDFRDISGDCQSALKQMLSECTDPETCAVLLGGFNIAWECSNILIALKNIQRIQQDGLTAVSGATSPLHRALLEDSKLPGSLSMRKWRLSRTGLKNLLCRPINLFLSCRSNLPLGKLPGFGGSGREGRRVALHSPVPLCKSYMATLPDWVHIRLINTWFGEDGRLSLSNGVEQKIDEAAEEMASLVEEIARRHGLRIGEKVLTHCKDEVASLLLHVAQDLARVRRALKKEGPFEYLGVSGTNYYSRILSLAVAQEGGTVTAFSHGGDTCRYLRDYSLAEFSTCDNFVVDNANCIPLFQQSLEAFPPPLDHSIHFIPREHGRYLSVWKSYGRKTPAARVRRVMLVSPPYHGELSMVDQHPDLIKWELDLRIVGLLRSAGYQVVYKQHPGGVLGKSPVGFFPDDVEVVREPFETVLDKADAFVLYHTVTTVLSSALCTNKPIVFIHCGNERWLDEPYELFCKRVEVVPGRFDEANRLMFDEERLLKALERKPSKPDESFVRTYYFPAGSS